MPPSLVETPRSVHPTLSKRTRGWLRFLWEKTTTPDDWSADALEALVRSFAEQKGVKLVRIAQPLRAALTGRTASPGIFQILVTLGRNESLTRLSERANGPA